MRLIDVNRLQSAVESIMTFTAPTVQVGEIVARADRLGSPCKSRRVVEYHLAQDMKGAFLSAWSGRHHIQVGGESPDPHPTDGYVGEFVQLTVPTTMVEPLFALARRVGLTPACKAKLVEVYVLRPSLAGWHYNRPVFWAVNAQNEQANSPAVVEGEPLLSQGGLEILLPPEVLQADLPTWNPWPSHRPWFYNHVPMNGTDTEESEEHAAPVAVLYKGLPRAALRLDGPVRLVARDHSPVELGAGSYIALHRFPDGSVD